MYGWKVLTITYDIIKWLESYKLMPQAKAGAIPGLLDYSTCTYHWCHCLSHDLTRSVNALK